MVMRKLVSEFRIDVDLFLQQLQDIVDVAEYNRIEGIITESRSDKWTGELFRHASHQKDFAVARLSQYMGIDFNLHNAEKVVELFDELELELGGFVKKWNERIEAIMSGEADKSKRKKVITGVADK